MENLLNNKHLIKSGEQNEKREFENRVIKFFTNKIPAIENSLNLTYSDCEDFEEVGLYMVLADIDRYFENCVKEQRFDKVREFLNVYWNFYKTFENEYHTLEKTDTMQNLTRVELFETIDCFDEQNKRKVIELLPEKLKEDYKLCTKM